MSLVALSFLAAYRVLPWFVVLYLAAWEIVVSIIGVVYHVAVYGLAGVVICTRGLRNRLRMHSFVSG
jgi:hypothetical protein